MSPKAPIYRRLELTHLVDEYKLSIQEAKILSEARGLKRRIANICSHLSNEEKSELLSNDSLIKNQ
jgi:hypothetical protein